MTEKPPLPQDLIDEIDRLAPQLTLLDHYAVLGVGEGSPESDIKAAYLRLIKRVHPDRWHARDSGMHRKRMEAIFARATEAYDVLRRPESKLEYDRSLYEIRGIPRPSSLPKPPPPPPARAPSSVQLAMAQRLMGQLRPPTVAPPRAPTLAPPRAPTLAPPRAPTVVPPTVMPATVMPATASSSTSGAALPTGPRPGIVVVEDDDTLRRMLVRIFQELGDVREARDGKEALDMLAVDPLPRLVVTDVMMPRMDGLELARRLKAAPRTARIPIVMLTAKHGPRDLIDGVNAGARVYVTKPFKVDDLKAKALKAMGPV